MLGYGCNIWQNSRHVHSRGIIYADLKPGNILLNEAVVDWSEKEWPAAVAAFYAIKL